PDSLVRTQGPEAFRRRIAEALPLSTFLIEELTARIDTKDVDGRARLVAEAKPLLARVPAGVYRELLIEELARLTGIEQSRFVALLEPQAAAPTRDRPVAPPPPRRGRSAIGRTSTLVPHHPGDAALAGVVSAHAEDVAPGCELTR